MVQYPMFSTARAKKYCRDNYIKWKQEYGDDEWFDVLNRRGRAIAEAPRTVCHSGPKLLHAVVHLQVFDGKGRIYLQQRSMKKLIQPGKWDSAVGGHVDPGEAVETALLRESREELSMKGFSPFFIQKYRWTSDQETELVHCFAALWNGELRPDPEEIEEGCFWSFTEIEEALGNNLLTPNFEWEWKKIWRKALYRGKYPELTIGVCRT